MGCIKVEALNKNDAELKFRRGTNYLGKRLIVTIITKATKMRVGWYKICIPSKDVRIWHR